MKHEAYCERDWEQHGITWVIVARERSPGWVEVAAFLVDPWCLGVKDAYMNEFARGDFDELLAEQIPDEQREPLDPACARKLVEGAVAYAQSLGFLPHRDFRKARKVLSRIDAEVCPREFTFGREGKPCYVAGPDDDETRINRVFGILSARLGEDGFSFINEGDEAIDAFYHFIDEGKCPNKSLTTSEADGFIVGLHLIPDPPPAGEWIPALWGGEGMEPVWESDEIREGVIEGLEGLHDVIAEDLRTSAYSPVLPEATEPDHLPWARQFAAGVLRALALRPSVLKWLRGHPNAAGVFTLFDRLAGASADAAEPHDFRTELADAVVDLLDLTIELRPPPASSRS